MKAIFFLSLLVLASGARSAPADRDDSPAQAHWSFQPAVRHPVPAVKNRSWVRNPIDAFVLFELERQGIQPSPEADRRTLIRRLSLDLTGLPPNPLEVDRFVNDTHPHAYENLVAHLLASPHFGERWGRHWLDLARFADSDGYEKDGPRPYAYLFRDWVIDAINRDLPFDRFTIEQLAGDLLSDATLEQKIATGFHRQTLTNKEGGVDQEEFRCKANVDRVATTSAVWLGLTVACAECHSHKYDPISQREFYQLYAFFNAAKESDIPAPPPGELARYEESLSAWKEKQASLTNAIDRYEADHAASPDADGKKSADAPELKKLRERLEKHRAQQPKPPPTKAAILIQNQKPPVSRIHIRGDFLRPGDEVQPGILRVLHPFKPRGETPDRLDLAQWLMDSANPLTARVTVNRYWQQLFGRALVTSPDDFGRRGDLPSHPQLLDWLATEFPRLGWSRKELIKLIVTSATYRQSSRFRPELGERDPVNHWLARQNRARLPAENVRDLYLSTGGLLSEKVGGPSIRPPLPADIAALGYANSVKWTESVGEDRYRRGLYIFFQRTVPYPMLITFDSPDGNATCTRREISNTPLQALTLLNDPVFFECAQALAKSVAAENLASPRARIQRTFELALARPVGPQELARLERFYEDQLRLLRVQPQNAPVIAGTAGAGGQPAIETAALVTVARTIMNLDEFITRE